MGNASTSAARLNEAAPTDPLTGNAPANDAYGSLATLASRPKPKKKPVLVLDADELAEAHLLFQQGAAEQLEDADLIERAPVTLSLAPLGSDVEIDDTPDDDEDEYAVEADAPAPEDVLNLTRSDAAPVADDTRKPKKSMVALPPDGDPALDAVEPFVPFADDDDSASDPVEEQLYDLPEVPQEEPIAEPQPPVDPVADEPVEADAPALIEDEERTLPLSLEEPAEPAEPAEPELEAAPILEEQQPAETTAEAAPVSDQPAATVNVTDIDEDEDVDGYAFMRGDAPRKLDISAAAAGSQNSLRARLVRGEEPVFEEEEPSLWGRITAWVANLWRKFLG